MLEFVSCSRNGQRALVRREWADVVAAALFEGQGCAPANEEGRGVLQQFTYPDGTGFVRRYRRGGLARHFVKEAYLLHNRPLRELRLHTFLYEQGAPVPAPLGACWTRRLLWFTGALATQQVDAVHLQRHIESEPSEPEDALRQCGAAIRQMHDLGVFHADLQVRNILVAPDRIYLIDFDNAVRVTALSPLERARNLLRLRRSLDKNRLPLEYFRPLCEGYGVAVLPEWISRVYRAKGRLSDLASGRLSAHDHNP